MWLNLTTGELDALKRLVTACARAGDAALVRTAVDRAEDQRPTPGEITAIEALAREIGGTELEIDPSHTISRSEDGFWAMAWAWHSGQAPSGTDSTRRRVCKTPECGDMADPNATWEGYCLHCDEQLGEEAVTLRFQCEAWQNDQAVPVDPLGPTEWLVPRKLLLERFPSEHDWENARDARDDMRFEGNPPAWITEWAGPFEIALGERWSALDPGRTPNWPWPDLNAR